MSEKNSNKFKERTSEIFSEFLNILIFVLKRFIVLIPTFIIITFVIFAICSFLPGDPVLIYYQPSPGTSEASAAIIRESLRAKYHLNDPLLVQYGYWLKGSFIDGDFGYSVARNAPALEVITAALNNTIILGLSVYIVTYIVAIPLGILTAVKKNKFIDKFMRVLTLVGISMPTFFFGLVLIYVFSINLKVTPISGLTSIGLTKGSFAYYADMAHHLILPVIVLSIGSVAGATRYVRNSMIEVLSNDYIRTAKAKGVKNSGVIFKHAFRNALIPVITLMTLSLPSIISGAIVTEQIFGYPGMGKLMITSVSQRDFAVLRAILVMFSLVVLLSNVLADVLYSIADPRIKLN